MRPAHAVQAFERFVALRGSRVADLGVAAGFDAVLAFYGDIRFDQCDLATDGDMLLYQWGTYDRGGGPHVELDLTRQLMVGDHADDDLWQLSLTFVFATPPSLLSLVPGQRWCDSPEDRDSLRTFIRACPAYAAALETASPRVDLRYQPAG
jgi:hypothetical protein